MNREAVALGVPVYTTFAGRLGAVDEQLVRRGAATRALPLQAISCSSKRVPGPIPTARDPALLLDLLLSALEG